MEILRDPIVAAGYLEEARNDSEEMYAKALKNVEEARTNQPPPQPEAPEKESK
jgi:hypothetical protein